jgi:ABC-2 type transport system permease protein
VRINPELVQDIQCNVIPVNVALAGNPPNFQPAPWLYDPLLAPSPDHPVSQNLNLVLGRFVNTIDTLVARKNISKQTLLTTSPYSRIRKVPTFISLEEIMKTPREEEFNQPELITGILLEGIFESAFVNRGMSNYFDQVPEVVPKSKSTRMAVIADGDIIRNDVRFSKDGPLISPLGYDRTTNQTFGNKDFMVNLVQYLADEDNLLELRGREFKLRLLDKERISSERQKWVLLNMIIPSCLVLLLGGLFIELRKRRYTK